MTGNNVIYYN